MKRKNVTVPVTGKIDEKSDNTRRADMLEKIRSVMKQHKLVLLDELLTPRGVIDCKDYSVVINGDVGVFSTKTDYLPTGISFVFLRTPSGAIRHALLPNCLKVAGRYGTKLYALTCTADDAIVVVCSEFDGASHVRVEVRVKYEAYISGLDDEISIKRQTIYCSEPAKVSLVINGPFGGQFDIVRDLLWEYSRKRN